MTTTHKDDPVFSDGPLPSTVASALRRGATMDLSCDVIPTQFEPLDTLLDGGLRSGQLTLVGGPPGVGKSIAALQWARAAAAAGTNVLYVSEDHDIRTLLTRLLLLEIGELIEAGRDSEDPGLRGSVAAALAANGGERDALAGENLVLRAAKARAVAYGEFMHLHHASSSDIDGPTFERLLAFPESGPTLLVVDRIPIDSDANGSVGMQLKDLAIRVKAAVVAVVGVGGQALARRRVRLADLQGAGALSHTADLVLILNEKVTAVSRRHTAFDSIQADEFRNHVVVSIEKNRSGPSGIDLDHRKDFPHYRIDPNGSVLEEQLVDGMRSSD